MTRNPPDTEASKAETHNAIPARQTGNVNPKRRAPVTLRLVTQRS
jgi:hypothetical protein